VPLRLLIRARRGGVVREDDADVTIERRVEASFEGDEIVLGRTARAGVELPFPSVSARHARIFREAGALRIEDLDSVNGTWLGARRLQQRVPEWLAAGDTLRVADVEVVVESELTDASEEPTPQSSATFARCLVRDLFAARSSAESVRLSVLGGAFDGHELPLSPSGRPFKVGRCECCDLVLPDENVSREHAAFERGLDGVLVRDMGSKNGIEVEGRPSKGSCLLHDGEVVRIGETRLRLIDPEDRYLRQVQAAADVKMPSDPPGGGPFAAVRSNPALPAPQMGVVPSAAESRVMAMSPAPAPLLDGSRSYLATLSMAVAGATLLLVVGLLLALAFAAQV